MGREPRQYLLHAMSAFYLRATALHPAYGSQDAMHKLQHHVQCYKLSKPIVVAQSPSHMWYSFPLLSQSRNSWNLQVLCVFIYSGVSRFIALPFPPVVVYCLSCSQVYPKAKCWSEAAAQGPATTFMTSIPGATEVSEVAHLCCIEGPGQQWVRGEREPLWNDQKER